MKNHGRKDSVKIIMKALVALTLLHQRGALSYEISCGNAALDNRIPPDKETNYPIDVIAPKSPGSKINALALNSTKEDSDVVMFDSD